MITYKPSQKILKKYADVLIKYALGSGTGIKPGEVIFLQVPESAKPILSPLILSVLEAKGHPLVHFVPEGTDRWMSADRLFFENANSDQIKYVPKNSLLGRVKDCDHFVSIIATNNKKDLQGIDSKKLMLRQTAVKFYKEARDKKENAGKLTWTLGLYGTPAMAKEAGLSLKDYWAQIINTCYLNKENPISEWKKVSKMVEDLKNKLNTMKIKSLTVKGKNVDLIVGVGEKRKWLGGSGRNIPSFEIFVSPDAGKTEGWVKFSEPLYIYGNLVEGIELKFKNGKVISVKAKKNEKLICDMVKVEGANRIGEFSLTDSRFSKITHFMAETLFDENMGGRNGNFHIALGASYKDSYDGDIAKVGKKGWEKLGFNESAVHTDIISTDDKTVTAYFKDGTSKVIYAKGKFTI